jgi:serine/threonine protein kinase
MTLSLGVILNDRYKIEKIITQGGMGAIYCAIDQALGVQVAIKENLISSSEAVRQFRHEATILGNLRHPNLPRVTDHFTIGDQGQYLVMDFIEGSDLRHKLNSEGPLQEYEVIQIGIAICDALNYLHNRRPPIVHRDIKPGNIKITPNGQIFLVDFGLAKESRPGQVTTLGAQALTPGYAPPEQYGQGTEPRSDIYALGATLYAALTNQTPEDAMARAMGSAGLTPIQKFRADINPQLANIINKATEVLPANRYQTALEFRTALVGLNTDIRKKVDQLTQARRSQVPEPSTQTSANNQDSQPTVLTTRTPPVPIVKEASLTKKSKSLFPILSIGGVLLCLALIAFIIFATPAQTLIFSSTATSSPTITPIQPMLVLTETNTVTPKPATATVLPTLPPTKTASPIIVPDLTFTPSPKPTALGGDPGLFAFVSDRTGLPQIFTANLQGQIIQQITNLPDGACQPTWSPDGKALAFTSPCKTRTNLYKNTGIFIINADGTQLRPIPSLPGGDFDPAWSPDGQSLAFCSLRENNIPHIFIYQFADQSTKLLSPPTSYDRHPTWSEDGKQIAFETTRQGVPQIWIMDLDGKNASEFSNLNNGAGALPDWSPDGKSIIFVRNNPSFLVARQLGSRAAPESILNQNLLGATSPKISKDGFWILLELANNNAKASLQMITFTGTNQQTIIQDDFNNYQPAWKPQ